MTSVEAYPRDVSASGLRLGLVLELGAYFVGVLGIAFLALSTGVFLLGEAGAAFTEGVWGALQPLALSLLILALGFRFSLCLGIAAWGHLRAEQRRARPISEYPLVSILVPAYNEAETIVAALDSLVQLDYPCYEVVLVDDGSTDATLELARAFARAFARDSSLRSGVELHVIAKENGGKWSAHNVAYHAARGTLLLCVDADSRLDRDALQHLVRALGDDDSIAGVAGQVRVRNRDRLLTRMQALEYLNCNGATRTAQSASGDVLVVPGPIGLFRRSALERVWQRFGTEDASPAVGGHEHAGREDWQGPYEADTFAEDFDLSIAILALGKKIVYEPLAISRTRAPTSLSALLNQRYRWQRGSIQVLRKLWRRSQREHELLGDRLLLWILATYVVDLVLVPLWLFLGLPYVVMTMVTGSSLASGLLMTLLVFQAVTLVLALCYIRTHRERASIALVLPLQDFYQTFVLQGILAFVVYDELRGAPMRWS